MDARKYVVECRKKKKKKENKSDQQNAFGENGDLKLQAKESSFAGGTGKEELQDYIDSYLERTSFIIQNAGRDEPYLLTTTTFQIKSSDDKYAKISEQDIPSQEFMINQQEQELKTYQKKKKNKNSNKNTYQNLPADLCNEDYFKSWFFSMDSLKRKYYPIYSEDNEGDFFYFELANEQIISDFNTVSCNMDPLIQLCDETPKNNFQKEVILEAQQNITILGLWICDIKVDNLKEKPKLDQINSQPVQRKQIALREIGLIDMIIKIILHTFRNEYLCMDVIQNNVEIYQFIQTAIEFLIKISLKNYANSMYIISWYSLFKKIILDSEVIMEFKFDKLVNQLFKETNINVSFQDDLRLIANEINFEDLNLNALNLLLSFCQYNPFRKKHEHEEITQFLIENDKTRQNLFRCFKINQNGMVYLELKQPKDQEHLITVIDKDFQFVSKDLYLYSMQVVNLTAELCKGGPSLIIDHIKTYYDFKVCLGIIGNDDIAAAYRAIFLNLFKESYLVNDFKYTLIEDLPSYIKIKNSADFQDTMLQNMFMQFRSKINSKYFYIQSEDDDNNNSIMGNVNQDPTKSMNIEKSHINLKVKEQNLFIFTNIYLFQNYEKVYHRQVLKKFYNSLVQGIDRKCKFDLIQFKQFY